MFIKQMFYLLLTSIALLFFTGCSHALYSKADLKEMHRKEFRKRVRYFNQENLKKYISTLPKNPKYRKKIKRQLKRFFKLFDTSNISLKIERINIKQNTYMDKTIETTFTMKGNEKVSPLFRPRRYKVINFFKRIDGKWKLISGGRTHFEFLDVR